MAEQRFSIVPGDFPDETRATLVHFQVILQLGRRTNKAGWCVINQTKLAGHLGVARQTINKAVGDLVSWGYVERRSQAQTKRNICFYRVIFDRSDPLSGPRQLPPDCGVDEVEIEAPAGAVQTVCGGSAEGGDVSPTDDTSHGGMCHLQTTPVSPTQDTSVASRGDTITYPLETTIPHTQRRAPPGRVCVDEFASFDQSGHRLAVVEAIRRMWGSLQRPRNVPDVPAMLAELARELAKADAEVLEALADALIAGRTRFPSVAQVRDRLVRLEAARNASRRAAADLAALEAARQREAEAGELVAIRRGDPKFSAWMDHFAATGTPTELAERTGVVKVRGGGWPPHAGLAADVRERIGPAVAAGVEELLWRLGRPGWSASATAGVEEVADVLAEIDSEVLGRVVEQLAGLPGFPRPVLVRGAIAAAMVGGR